MAGFREGAAQRITNVYWPPKEEPDPDPQYQPFYTTSFGVEVYDNGGRDFDDSYGLLTEIWSPITINVVRKSRTDGKNYIWYSYPLSYGVRGGIQIGDYWPEGGYGPFAQYLRTKVGTMQELYASYFWWQSWKWDGVTNSPPYYAHAAIGLECWYFYVNYPGYVFEPQIYFDAGIIYVDLSPLTIQIQNDEYRVGGPVEVIYTDPLTLQQYPPYTTFRLYKG